MYIPRAFAQKAQLDAAIDAIKSTLGPDVVNLKYELGEDWTGDAAIFFKVVLTNEASRRDRLHQAASHVRDEIRQRLEPLEQWGILPYFSFRSLAEQEALHEEAWA